ncbi:hypothetical protein [Levilactobacillus spicheri]|uniref:hypothetical protein n=1 Tax=Levilactobacillus spicheri TaxID=216463 RepID=UPI000A4912AE|nr:hypothetical protein [Levilactobacillus spicheri]
MKNIILNLLLMMVLVTGLIEGAAILANLAYVLNTTVALCLGAVIFTGTCLAVCGLVRYFWRRSFPATSHGLEK